jgi:hypothetical protein
MFFSADNIHHAQEGSRSIKGDRISVKNQYLQGNAKSNVHLSG